MVESGRRLRRFTSLQITVHWIFALSFLLALLTGIFQYLPHAFGGQFSAYAIGAAGETSRLLHRLSAGGFALAVLLYLIGGFRELGRDMRLIFSWSGDDTKWLIKAPWKFYWNGNREGLPEEGFYNAGQKQAYQVQLIGFIVLAVTGAIMWLGGDYFSATVFQWCVLLHNIATLFTVAFFMLHLYLTTLHPFTKEAISAMFIGTVSEEYAKVHHPKWYKEQSEQAS